jgi:hypothetical protein
MGVPAGTVTIFFCGTADGSGRDQEVPVNPTIAADNKTIGKIL